jgi:hypothetical protein
VILWVQLTHDPCHPMDFKTVQWTTIDNMTT